MKQSVAIAFLTGFLNAPMSHSQTPIPVAEVLESKSQTHELTDELKQKLFEIYQNGIHYVLNTASLNQMELINFPPRGAIDVNASQQEMDQFREVANKIADFFYNQPLSLYPDQTVLYEIRKKAYEALDATTKAAILDLISLQFINKKIFSPILFFPDWYTDSIHDYIKSGKLQKELRSLPIGTFKGSVAWDTQFEQYKYDNIELAKKISRIVLAAEIDQISFRNSVEELPMEYLKSLRTNTQTANGASKFETFDLIQGMFANYLEFNHAQNYLEFDRTVASKLSHRVFYDLLQSTPEEDSRGGSLPYLKVFRKKLGNQADFICAGPMYFDQINVDTAHTILKFWDKDIADFANHQSFTCGKHTYRIELQKEDSIQFPKPEQFDLERFRGGKPVSVTVNLSLIEEVSGPMVGGAQVFLATKGYRLLKKEKVPTLENMRQDFESSHIFVPAAHSLDINRFQFGTKESIRFQLRKIVKGKNGSVPIDVNLYLPVKKSEPLEESGVIVADWLSNRRKKIPHPLFVLNASCNSENNNFAWNSVYHMSMQKDLDDGTYTLDSMPKDHIYSIGSKVGFDTGKPSEVLQNFYYPILFMETLAKGMEVTEVIEQLSKPVPSDPVLGLVRGLESVKDKWDQIWGRIRNLNPKHQMELAMFARNPDQPERTNPHGFGPVFNLDDPDVLQSGTEFLVLTDTENDSRVLRF